MPNLSPHPGGQAPALTVTAAAEREGTELLLRFDVVGELHGLVIPRQAAAPARRDGLWRTTCFEAFVRPSGSEAYWEINLAPSGDWALYHFTGRRAGITSPDAAAPAIAVSPEPGRLLLRGSIDFAGLLSPAVPWELNLTGVIGRHDGPNSYWALAHPPEGPPDFHDPDCFVLALAPPSAA